MRPENVCFAKRAENTTYARIQHFSNTLESNHSVSNFLEDRSVLEKVARKRFYRAWWEDTKSNFRENGGKLSKSVGFY